YRAGRARPGRPRGHQAARTAARRDRAAGSHRLRRRRVPGAPRRAAGGLTSPVPRAKQRTGQLREHIVPVAVAMLAVDGVEGFTARKVAEQAQTSPPAVYELFGDKAGLVREVFFAGFRLLGDRFARLPESADPRADLLRAVQALRTFVRDNPVL